MKVLIISPYFFEPHRWMISAYKTALALSKNTQVIVVTTGRPYKEKMNKNLMIYRLHDFFLPDPVNFSFVPFLGWQLYSIIKKEKPDCFLINKHMFYTSLAIFWLKLLGKKVIVQTDTFPGIIWFPRNPLVNFIMKLYARTIGLWVLLLADKVVLLHQGLVETAKKWKLKYEVIPTGVDFDLLNSAKPDFKIKHLKNELNIIYAGRLESIKGYEDYLQVAQRMLKKYIHINFYVAGNTIDKEEIVKKYQSKRLIFLGHREDIYSVLKRMDIFVLPSYSEGLPNALMESMALGLACVSSGVGGVKYLIKDDVNGLTFSPGDQEKMETQLEKLIKNKYLINQFGRRAKKLIFKNYNLDLGAKKLKKLLLAYNKK